MGRDKEALMNEIVESRRKKSTTSAMPVREPTAVDFGSVAFSTAHGVVGRLALLLLSHQMFGLHPVHRFPKETKKRKGLAKRWAW